MRTRAGAEYAVYLQLNDNEDSRYTNLDGHLSWCARGLPTVTSTVDGTTNRSGSDVKVFSYAPDHLRPGLVPSEFRGSWHGSTLVLNVAFELYHYIGSQLFSTAPDGMGSVRLTLRKGGYSSYLAVCARLSHP